MRGWYCHYSSKYGAVLACEEAVPAIETRATSDEFPEKHQTTFFNPETTSSVFVLGFARKSRNDMVMESMGVA